MHLLMIIIALGLAWGFRLATPRLRKNTSRSWQRSLFFFLFPPLLLLMTSVAVICMGYQGQMFGLEASRFSYCLAAIFLTVASLSLLKLSWQAWRSIHNLRTYPQEIIAGKRARILNITFPYSAQIGFWQPELVISQGLLETLDTDHLKAVLAHEQAHYNHRDTFWFFWLGWIRSLTTWLPNTETLWQDLLFLREIRADQQAAKHIDPLLLAESLLIVAQVVNQSPLLGCSESFCAAFNDLTNRIEERIDQLLETSNSSDFSHSWTGILILFCLLPLIMIPWHY